MADDNNFDRKTLPDESAPIRHSCGDGPDGLINSPQLDDEGDPTQRAIADAGQARDVVNFLIESNRHRQQVNGRIYSRWNSERPFNQASLKADGTDYKQNFSTRTMATITEKVTARFVEVVDSLRYFTDAKLSDRWQGATEKTEKFRAGITELIRSHPEWNSLLEEIALENCLFGNAVLASLDEFSWFPKAFAQDSHFLPDGNRQCVDSTQVAVLREVFLPHELLEHIKSKDAAKKAGWDIDATIKVINAAAPTQYKDIIASASTPDSAYQEAVRNLNMGASFTRSASVIQVYNIFAREVNGKVSHYRLGGSDMALIFARDDRFDAMSDCLAFFAYERANGTMAGSKGLGRALFEFSGMLERLRNEIVDRSVLSGKVILQGDPRNLSKLKLSLLGNLMIIPNGWELREQRMDNAVEPMLRLDAYLGRISDAIVGAVSPPAVEGEAFRSSAAWQVTTAREEEARDARISRFLKFFVKLIAGMQRRICAKRVDDKAAKEFRKKMLEIMTEEELQELAEAPVATAIQDLTAMERQLTVTLAAEKKGHPLYDQRALEIEDVTARLGADVADRLIIAENDPTVQAEQQRAQQIEFSVLAEGQPVPVSPRDNHEIHLSVLVPLAQSVAQAIMEGSTGTAVLEAVIAHVTEHYNFALQQGVPKEKLKPVAELVKNSGKVLAEMKKLDQQAEQVSAESEQFDAEPQPPMIPQ